VNLNCNFLSAAFAEKIFAEGKIVRKGRSMFFTDCRILDAKTGKILSTASGIFKYLE
ncbi:MAG: acyl-coenzyme A thioesterase PaaI-like protein, partial [Alphaproteobacteria bacterium]